MHPRSCNTHPCLCARLCDQFLAGLGSSVEEWIIVHGGHTRVTLSCIGARVIPVVSGQQCRTTFNQQPAMLSEKTFSKEKINLTPLLHPLSKLKSVSVVLVPHP